MFSSLSHEFVPDILLQMHEVSIRRVQRSDVLGHSIDPNRFFGGGLGKPSEGCNRHTRGANDDASNVNWSKPLLKDDRREHRCHRWSRR